MNTKRPPPPVRAVRSIPVMRYNNPLGSVAVRFSVEYSPYHIPDGYSSILRPRAPLMKLIQLLIPFVTRLDCICFFPFVDWAAHQGNEWGSWKYLCGKAFSQNCLSLIWYQKSDKLSEWQIFGGNEEFRRKLSLELLKLTIFGGVKRAWLWKESGMPIFRCGSIWLCRSLAAQIFFCAKRGCE